MLITLIGLLLLLATFALAWAKGGAAERGGAILIAAVWVVELAFAEAVGTVPIGWILALDTIQAVGFLALALRYSSLWLGAAMLLQSAVLTLHFLRLADIGFTDRQYVVWINIVGASILFIIIGGTLAAWRKRAKERGGRQGDAQASLSAAPV